jgi:hypothetical protein
MENLYGYNSLSKQMNPSFNNLEILNNLNVEGTLTAQNFGVTGTFTAESMNITGKTQTGTLGVTGNAQIGSLGVTGNIMGNGSVTGVTGIFNGIVTNNITTQTIGGVTGSIDNLNSENVITKLITAYSSTMGVSGFDTIGSYALGGVNQFRYPKFNMIGGTISSWNNSGGYQLLYTWAYKGSTLTGTILNMQIACIPATTSLSFQVVDTNTNLVVAQVTGVTGNDWIGKDLGPISNLSATPTVFQLFVEATFGIVAGRVGALTINYAN